MAYEYPCGIFKHFLKATSFSDSVPQNNWSLLVNWDLAFLYQFNLHMKHKWHHKAIDVKKERQNVIKGIVVMDNHIGCAMI